MIIIICTVAIGLLLFHLLVASEWLRRLITTTSRSMRVDWGRVYVKPTPRRYMIRHAGTLTVDPSMPGIVTHTSHTASDFDSGDFDPYHSRL